MGSSLWDKQRAFPGRVPAPPGAPAGAQGAGRRAELVSPCHGAWELLWEGLGACLLSLGLGSYLPLRGSDPGLAPAGLGAPRGDSHLGAEPRQTQEPRGHLHSCLQSTGLCSAGPHVPKPGDIFLLACGHCTLRPRAFRSYRHIHALNLWLSTMRRKCNIKTNERSIKCPVTTASAPTAPCPRRPATPPGCWANSQQTQAGTAASHHAIPQTGERGRGRVRGRRVPRTRPWGGQRLARAGRASPPAPPARAPLVAGPSNCLRTDTLELQPSRAALRVPGWPGREAPRAPPSPAFSKQLEPPHEHRRGGAGGPDPPGPW